MKNFLTRQKFCRGCHKPNQDCSCAFAPDQLAFRQELSAIFDEKHLIDILYGYYNGWDHGQFGEKEQVYKIAISANKRIVTLSHTGKNQITVAVWDGRAQALLHAFNSAREVSDVSISSDGNLIFFSSKSDSMVSVWNCHTRGKMSPLKIGGLGINSIALSEDGNFMGIIDCKNTVKVWDMKKCAVSSVFPPTPHIPANHPRVAISANGQFIVIVQLCAAPEQQMLQVWRKDVGKLNYTLMQGCHRKEGSIICDMVISKDGSQIIAANSNREIEIWNVSAGILLRKIQSKISNDIFLNNRHIYGVALSSDGEHVVWSSLLGEVMSEKIDFDLLPLFITPPGSRSRSRSPSPAPGTPPDFEAP